MAQPLGIRNW